MAQQYADQYLAVLKTERVLHFTGMQYTMYSAGLKNPQGEPQPAHQFVR
ncbi:MAG: hypothetical protein V3S85_00680 [Nitrospirales bacterium]